MTVVVDASIVAAAVLPDEAAAEADQVLELLASGAAIAPSLFWHEIRNLCWQAERRHRIHPGEADELLRDLRLAPPLTAEDRGDDVTLRLARAHGLTAYDAAYAALAVDTGAPLATLDKALRAAAATGAFRLWDGS